MKKCGRVGCSFRTKNSEYNFCPLCQSLLEEVPVWINKKLYLHESGENNFSLAKTWGMSDDAAEKFEHCCYEITLDIEVNLETGESKLIAVEDVKLATKIKLT